MSSLKPAIVFRIFARSYCIIAAASNLQQQTETISDFEREPVVCLPSFDSCGLFLDNVSCYTPRTLTSSDQISILLKSYAV
jgi:hypothetical protein